MRVIAIRGKHVASAEQAATKIAAPGDPFVLDTLAAAHASAGEFDRAVRFQEEAISNVPANFADPFNGAARALPFAAAVPQRSERRQRSPRRVARGRIHSRAAR